MQADTLIEFAENQHKLMTIAKNNSASFLENRPNPLDLQTSTKTKQNEYPAMKFMLELFMTSLVNKFFCILNPTFQPTCMSQ